MKLKFSKILTIKTLVFFYASSTLRLVVLKRIRLGYKRKRSGKAAAKQKSDKSESAITLSRKQICCGRHGCNLDESRLGSSFFVPQFT